MQFAKQICVVCFGGKNKLINTISYVYWTENHGMKLKFVISRQCLKASGHWIAKLEKISHKNYYINKNSQCTFDICQINNVGEFLKNSKLLGLSFALIFQGIKI